MTALVAALKGGSAADKLWTDGLHIGGERYVVTKAEDRSIYGRKVCFYRCDKQAPSHHRHLHLITSYANRFSLGRAETA
jgi:hypothetical protein